MPARPLNATAASLLGLLHEGPMTGWDLVALAQQRIGRFWTLTQSQVYRELAGMAGEGLVERGEPGRRDRRPYRITEAGRAAFAEWVNEDPAPEQIRFPLLLTIMFAGHLPSGRLAEILTSHRAVHAARLAEYQRIRRELADLPADHARAVSGEDRFRLATLEFGLRYELAVLDWFDHVSGLLSDA